MLQVYSLSKSYGPLTVLQNVSFILNDQERVGLIGPNGAGKSTLLRCITGRDMPDSGHVSLSPPGLTIGYLAQALDSAPGLTVAAYLAQAQAAYTTAERSLQAAAEALAHQPDALERYEAALAAFEALGGYEREHRATAVLDGLQLGEIAPERAVDSLSGGQKTRLALAALLLSEPDLLLLDEPTNHLDVDALEWLEGFVRAYPHAVLVVSHDREFLDRTVERILYLDGETRILRSYTGNYTDFAAVRAQELEARQAAWQDQQLYIKDVETDIKRVKGLAQSIQHGGPKRGRDYHGRISAKVARQARSRERKLERYLEAEERLEKPRQSWGMRLDFGPVPESGRAVVRVEDLAFAYPGAARLFEQVNLDVGYGERVAIVGPNGAGKTTLLRLIAGLLEPATGRVRLGSAVRLGVLAQEHETLDPQQTILATALRERPMSETDARSFLHFFLFGGDSVFRQIEQCSLGERSRLQLALLVLRGCNLLLLDEPLNHLDIDAREHFEEALNAFEGTIIAISHDRAFLRSFAERVIAVEQGHVSVYNGGYDDYLRQRR